MSEALLHRYGSRLSSDERDTLLGGHTSDDIHDQRVARGDGTPIDIAVLNDLFEEMSRRRGDGEWKADRAESDRWLAPRVHYALRLTRDLAASREMWEWLAICYQDYTEWRWSDKSRNVTQDHWYGPVHKQAIARLWWGAELFRNGDDYRPVERAFIRQDLINSYLHRPLVRCRSLALGSVETLVPGDNPSAKSAAEVNNLARVLNLATAGAPPELETKFQRDDLDGYLEWVVSAVSRPEDWSEIPAGPSASDTTADALRGGLAIAQRGWSYAAPS